jgi:protein SCO1/2
MRSLSPSQALLSVKWIERALCLITMMILLISCINHAGIVAGTVSSASQQSKQSSGEPHSPVQESTYNKAGVRMDDIPDLTLVDQYGNKILFRSQLLKGKVVAINFVYTACKSFCTAQGATFAKLQAILGDKLGERVNLITITTDPETDTPERLKEWGKTFGAKRGWAILTGEKRSIQEILKALTGDVGGKGMHSPVVLIGNLDKGEWIRDYGLADSEELAATLERVK